MRVPQLVSEFFSWRWAPCVGLTAGSLAFVALAVLLVPAQFEASASNPEAAQHSLRTSTALEPRTLFGASLAQATSNLDRTSEESSRALSERASSPPRSLNQPPAPPVARGFSPVLDRPEPPPPPPPPPPVAPSPAPSLAVTATPEGGSVVMQQPAPGGPEREVTTQ